MAASSGSPSTGLGRMPPVVPLLQPGQPPGSAGNNARDTDIPRRLRIRARQCWNPSVTDVIVNTRPDVGGLGRRNSPRVHDALETAFTISGLSSRRQVSGSEKKTHVSLPRFATYLEPWKPGQSWQKLPARYC